MLSNPYDTPAYRIGPYIIRVEMWYESQEDPLDLESVGEFIWGTKFHSGQPLVFDHPSEALAFITQARPIENYTGFEYRYRVTPDRKRGEFGYDDIPF